MKKTAMFVLVLLVATMAMPAAAAASEEPTGFLQMIVQHLRLRSSGPPVLAAGITRESSTRRMTQLVDRDSLGNPICRCTSGLVIPAPVADPNCLCCDVCARRPWAAGCGGGPLLKLPPEGP